tara:strand:- start:50376 stop:50750 length:375 start_codon:yes stop_codon:yes gene_type:complete
MPSLDQSLKETNQSLLEALDVLGQYKNLNPKLEMLVGLIGMIYGISSNLNPDVLSELSSLPDNYSSVLDGVNLTVGKYGNLINIHVYPTDPDLFDAFVISDESFTSALMQVYSNLKGDDPELEM